MVKPLEYWKEKISTLPDGLNATQAAKLLGDKYHTVRPYLMALYASLKDGRYGMKPEELRKRLHRFDHSNLDFSKTDKELAKRFKVSRQAINKLRLQWLKKKNEEQGTRT